MHIIPTTDHMQRWRLEKLGSTRAAIDKDNFTHATSRHAGALAVRGSTVSTFVAIGLQLVYGAVLQLDQVFMIKLVTSVSSAKFKFQRIVYRGIHCDL